MPRSRPITRCLAAATLAALALAAPAAASPTQESILQDDPLLLGATHQAQADTMLAILGAIGVDRVRVSLFWDHVAPRRLSQRKPGFPGRGPSSPGAYPRGRWERYDRIVLAADKAGVGVLLSATGPGPAWSTPGRRCAKAGPFRGCQEGIYRPSPREFGAFVQAAGTRYSGAYRVPGQAERLPRVDHWSIWNEPNYPAWLRPIWLGNRPRTASQMVAAAPHHYRRLVDAAYAGLARSGHGRDTILIGETSPRGAKNPKQLGDAMMPAEFARELYCLTPSYRAYEGRAARLRDCPATGAERGAFLGRHPGLFRSQGWAHHPYSLARKRWQLPTWHHRLKDNVSIGNLGRLTGTLDRAAFYWGSAGEDKEIWITEYGYQTTPPDPTAGVRPERQGPLSAWGEYLAYRNPRVASIAQFLLIDDKPLPGLPRSDPRRWVSWQSGLLTADRKPKPFLDDYRSPLHVDRRGGTARVFGTYRPAVPGTPMLGVIEFAPDGAEWRPLRIVRVDNPRGYIYEAVRLPGAGRVRIVWHDLRTGHRVTSPSRALAR